VVVVVVVAVATAAAVIIIKTTLLVSTSYSVDYRTNENGGVGGMRIGKGKRGARRKSTPTANLSTSNPT
jgi:hypothetical protein